MPSIPAGTIVHDKKQYLVLFLIVLPPLNPINPKPEVQMSLELLRAFGAQASEIRSIGI